MSETLVLSFNWSPMGPKSGGGEKRRCRRVPSVQYTTSIGRRLEPPTTYTRRSKTISPICPNSFFNFHLYLAIFVFFHSPISINVVHDKVSRQFAPQGTNYP